MTLLESETVVAVEYLTKGSMLSSDFLTEKIGEPNWNPISDLELVAFDRSLRQLFEALPPNVQHYESDTANEIVIPLLKLLGWEHYLLEQGLSKNRLDIPDGLLFESESQKSKAREYQEQWAHYKFGLAFFEVKRWNLPLERDSKLTPSQTSPTSQMLRYVRRVDDITNGKLRWGILTNGALWRLYYAGSNSVSEQFFELNLFKVLEFGKKSEDDDDSIDLERLHWLRVFYGMFCRRSFIAGSDGKTTFHKQAIAESRYYEQRISEDLSRKVFEQVFPSLVQAISNSAPKADLGEVRDSALVLLYRLLFVLYAEDRDLLPTTREGYRKYSLRFSVRFDVQTRIENKESLSSVVSIYWDTISSIFKIISKGDASIGLPPYNGGLFDLQQYKLLNTISIPDATMVWILDALSSDTTSKSRKYINYRNLSIQHLGSIYEKLLEFEVRRQGDKVAVVPKSFTRKVSGSYYTPDDLVKLVVTETLAPIIEQKKQNFSRKVEELQNTSLRKAEKLEELAPYDVAVALLNLKVCDPAMGSGHFLINLIDILADEINDAIEDNGNLVPTEWGIYRSPVYQEINDIRTQLLSNALKNNWGIDGEQIDDRQLIKRMFLKRCVYGVDKNPMAVELAKVSLWLHTVTSGAPLTFLDHHLSCGDSLFGMWIEVAQKKANKYGAPLLWQEYMKRAYLAADQMREMEKISDSEIKQAKASARIFENLTNSTDGLDAILKFVFALDWIDIESKNKQQAIKSFFDGQLGDPVAILTDRESPNTKSADGTEFKKILDEVSALIKEEQFMNWQVAFPGVWSEWEKSELTGGFDAIIGNPPWDRMKLEQIEWFAERRPEIAETTRAVERKAKIKTLSSSSDPIATEYIKASDRVAKAREIVRDGGEYPLLSSGDVNLYLLFVERAFKLVNKSGMVGLLVPSGIAHDFNAATFFKKVTSNGQLRAFYDFENARRGKKTRPFFPDVVRQMKFCAFIASQEHSNNPVRCAFYLNDVVLIEEEGATNVFYPKDFRRFNPNTGTLPIFRSVRDAELAKVLYENSVPFVEHRDGGNKSVWPVSYKRMFDMTNHSHLFRTKEELETKETAYSIGNNVYNSPSGKWLPLYVGKMIHQFDHRAASVKLNEENLHNPAITNSITELQKANPDFSPTPLYWVNENEVKLPEDLNWFVSFRNIARATDSRTMIATGIPKVGIANSAPLLVWDQTQAPIEQSALLLGNLGVTVLDYASRQKVQGTNLNWYIVEQLPMIPPSKYIETKFGQKNAEQIVKEIVLELTYTAHDMAAFAVDMGFVSKNGKVKKPFTWNNKRRLNLRAKLDAVYFFLYGLTNRKDIEYIYSTFPIVQKGQEIEFGESEISTKLCLNYMNALSSGDPDAFIKI